MAIADLKDAVNVRVTWEPYLMKESGPFAVPPEGRPLIPPDAEPTFHKLADRGKQVGVDMMGNVTRVPNTTLSHVLLEWAHEQRPEAQHQLKELIFQAYYSKNIYLDLEALVAMARQTGYDADAARAHLISGKGEAVVRQKSNAAKRIVNGVPYISINDKPAFEGAQDPAVFKRAIQKAAGK